MASLVCSDVSFGFCVGSNRVLEGMLDFVKHMRKETEWTSVQIRQSKREEESIRRQTCTRSLEENG